MLVLAVPRQVRGIVRGIVRVSFRQQYRPPPPIQSPFLEVTSQMAVLFDRCALREGSAKQAFCQCLKLASRGYHREVASKRSSRVDSWQRYSFIAVPCGKTPQHMRCFTVTSRCYPQEVETIIIACFGPCVPSGFRFWAIFLTCWATFCALGLGYLQGDWAKKPRALVGFRV